MQIERKKIRDMDRAAYNPRIELIPGDTEYENLRRSITTYGLIIPVVWNKRTNRVVGGHQRLTVLENEGETEVDVSVVDLDETQERQLNVALNKVEGGWDEEKLGDLLAELGEDATLTGFTQQEIANNKRMFVVQYGINLDEYGEVLLSAVAEQVQNIPDDLDDLYITCGSGITASGVIVGIERYGKNVKNIHLIATAFDRQEKVRDTLRRFGVAREFIYHDLFHTPGFTYEKQQKLRIGGVKLHPQYEAKTMKYVVEHNLNTRNALFWIVGAEPRKR